MKQGRFYLNSNGRCIWRDVKVMEYFPQRLVGMLYLRVASPQRAFWFPRCSSIHTWGMRFAIDVIGLDNQLKIVTVIRNVQPAKVIRLAGVDSIIECEAGCPLPLEAWQGQSLQFSVREPVYD
ncbi:MAG: hypothetical protein B7X54_04790 [Idiomarina sp. 34-48-12]|nr:MAG: hypothetical protein B7X54_04790 [Idiomarina sp. 34-48-12]